MLFAFVGFETLFPLTTIASGTSDLAANCTIFIPYTTLHRNSCSQYKLYHYFNAVSNLMSLLYQRCRVYSLKFIQGKVLAKKIAKIIVHGYNMKR
jgi:hypothetical protein